MDWRALLHNRWVWIGGAAAGGLGLAMYVKGRKGPGTGASATVGAPATPAYAGGSVGGFDSTGTDVAAWLGNYSGNLQNQLDQYHQQLTDSLSALQNVPTSGGASTAYAAAGQDLYGVGDLNRIRALNPDIQILWTDPTPAHPDALTPYLATGTPLRVA